MDNLLKQIEYWKQGAISDISTAAILIKKKKYSEGMFFCHLCIEKVLKALYVKMRSDIAPKTHNLFTLCAKIGIIVEDPILDFFGLLMKYQIQGRYPDFSPSILDKKQIAYNYKKTKEILQWLTDKLSK